MSTTVFIFAIPNVGNVCVHPYPPPAGSLGQARREWQRAVQVPWKWPSQGWFATLLLGACEQREGFGEVWSFLFGEEEEEETPLMVLCPGGRTGGKGNCPQCFAPVCVCWHGLLKFILGKEDGILLFFLRWIDLLCVCGFNYLKWRFIFEWWAEVINMHYFYGLCYFMTTEIPTLTHLQGEYGFWKIHWLNIF